MPGISEQTCNDYNQYLVSEMTKHINTIEWKTNISENAKCMIIELITRTEIIPGVLVMMNFQHVLFVIIVDFSKFT